MAAPLWPGRLCAGLLLVLLTLLLLAPRAGAMAALQRDAPQIRAATGSVLTRAVVQAATYGLRRLPGGCESLSSTVCAFAAAGGVTPWQLPVHVFTHSALLSLWIGLLYPLGWLADDGVTPRCAPLSGAAGAVPVTLQRWLQACLPLATLIWSCLPGMFGLTPWWAMAWLLAARGWQQGGQPRP